MTGRASSTASVTASDPARRGKAFLVVAMDVGELLMARRSLLGVKDRAERRARARPGAHEPVDHSPASPLTYELSVVVRRPPAEVYAVLADVQDLTDTTRSGVSMVKEPPGGARAGTQWRESVRLGQGLSLVVRSVVTEVRPGRTLAMTFGAPGLTGCLRYALETAQDGTLLRQSQRLRLRAPLAAVTRTVDGAFRRRVVRRLADLRDVVERQP